MSDDRGFPFAGSPLCGKCKNNISRELDEGRDIPAMKRRAKRFLPASSGNLHSGQNGQTAPPMIGKPVSGSMS